ncbi:hypothetical protein EVA_11536 [gut metagenome]|uniref:Uncharacterized protein n=1 Tax=gut metagenome TaxID=749906 RepID=J9GEY9_9ZZZZ
MIDSHSQLYFKFLLMYKLFQKEYLRIFELLFFFIFF